MFNIRDKTKGLSCIDYANEYSWRNSVIEIIKGF